MPTQERVWREERANIFECLPAERFRFDCQSPPLIVIEQQTFRAE